MTHNRSHRSDLRYTCCTIISSLVRLQDCATTPELCVVLVMERRQAEQPFSSDQLSSEPSPERSETATPLEHGRSLETGQQEFRPGSPPASESEALTDDSAGEERHQTRRRWSGSPDSTKRHSVRETSKGKEREMSSSAYTQSSMGVAGGDQRKAASSPSERRPDHAPTSSTSPSRQASEEARSGRKDTTGERAGGGRGSGGSSGRPRLVSGVFVRY